MSHYNQLDSSGVSRTKILLLGLRRSGKTSIQQVLFNSMTPKETFYLDATMRIVKHTYDTIIPLEIWDCPGNITVETLGVPLSIFSTLVFVIDIRDLYNQPISRLVEFIIAAYHHNPSLNLEIFVHKAEKLQEDEKIENFRQINERVMDRLMDVSPSLPNLPNSSSNSSLNTPNSSGTQMNSSNHLNWQDFIEQQLLMNFYLTSIFDHSLHQAFSKVLQRLTDSLPYLEDLLNIYCANSQASKVFLFDAPSRLYVTSDASPVDVATYNLCCDNLAMINAFGMGLYSSASASPVRRRRGNPESCTNHSPDPSNIPPTPPPSATSVNGKSFPSSSSSSTLPTPSRKSTGTSAKSKSSDSSVPASTTTPSSTTSFLPSSSLSSTATTITKTPGSVPTSTSQNIRIQTPQDLFYPCGATSLQPSSLPPSYSSSSGLPMPGTTIMWHLVTTGETSLIEEAGLISSSRSDCDSISRMNKSSLNLTNSISPTFTTFKNPTLILLVLLPTAVWESRRGLVELNVIAVREGVQEIVDLEREGRGTRVIGDVPLLRR
ncbi:Gtr1/RagA G protein conserved region-domain-containing protein [Lentinula aff. detonsa]|uniref:Gtr1/RagA G protein conserved region-domain-containing protein n=1 Tax=Lentinula aff. detonsa TaxID=2804958 RepID=A0AA38L2G5_9AGAR|nr:Gtr1/RagA G protein conserved region-domain-containing protein [Lentinula aff. detonsa]KAJ3796819.1 Gtr1/RagA G protein conserved region-domain-containing protein [Lentinula aff. detonsa]